MKNLKFIALALLMFGVIFLTNCQQRLNNITNLYSGSGTQIIAFGDSITSGYGLEAIQAYPSLLSEILGYPVLNRGINGDTTSSGLARLKSDVLEKDPWLVIVGLGGNDYLRKVPIAETEANLREIITQIQQEGAIVVLLGMNVSIFTKGFKELYENISQNTGSYLIPDVLKGILDDPKYRQSDLIHPNADGQKRLAKRIAESLKPLLEKATLSPQLLPE
ncbi:MAG: arylesterase [Halothece sp.]